ncbi:MAG: methylaspartate mutase subunit [Alphaproteobacteria bacterium]|nr:methylaspartate mutase subunit [Alphaproteobacteria bacterium]
MLSKFLKTRSDLYVQPRMGMASLENMQAGLKAVKSLELPVVGTITLDSYTRMGQFDEAKKSLQAGLDLNGFPVLAYSPSEIMEQLSSLGTRLGTERLIPKRFLDTLSRASFL